MADIFASAPGVIGLANVRPGPIALVTGLDGWPFGVIKAIVTGFEVAGEENTSALHSLNRDILLQTFGVRAGVINIAGVCFPAACGSGDSHGAADVYLYYQTYRTSNNLLPLAIGMAGGTFLGYLVGCTIKALPPEWSGAAQFSLRFLHAE